MLALTSGSHTQRVLSFEPDTTPPLESIMRHLISSACPSRTASHAPVCTQRREDKSRGRRFFLMGKHLSRRRRAHLGVPDAHGIRVRCLIARNDLFAGQCAKATERGTGCSNGALTYSRLRGAKQVQLACGIEKGVEAPRSKGGFDEALGIFHLPWDPKYEGRRVLTRRHRHWVARGGQ